VHSDAAVSFWQVCIARFVAGDHARLKRCEEKTGNTNHSDILLIQFNVALARTSPVLEVSLAVALSERTARKAML